MYLFKIIKQTAKFTMPAALLLAGCQFTPPATERNFGASVRNMIAVQTAKPIENPSGLDGQKAEAVLDIYRKDVAEPKKVEQDIIEIDLGK